MLCILSQWQFLMTSDAKEEIALIFYFIVIIVVLKFIGFISLVV